MAKCFTKTCKKGAVVKHRETNKDGKVKSFPYCSDCSGQQIFDPSAGYTCEVIDIASKNILNVCKPK